jgi:hypothetical protein
LHYPGQRLARSRERSPDCSKVPRRMNRRIKLENERR